MKISGYKKEKNKDEKFGSVMLHSVNPSTIRGLLAFVHFYWQPYMTTVYVCWSLGSLELDCIVDVSRILSLFIMKTLLLLLRDP
jgi:hypothetical protein